MKKIICCFALILQLGYLQTQSIAPSAALVDAIFGAKPTPTISPKTQSIAPSAALVDAIFGAKPTPTISPKNPDKPCECVPYYLCAENKTINVDGAGIFNFEIDDEEVLTVCPHYLEFCCQKADQLDEPIIPDPLPPRKGCGYRREDGVGFRIDPKLSEAKFGELPWMVAILSQDLAINGSVLTRYKCGGALIHPRAVITAAHCVGNDKPYRIRAGEWDTQHTLEVFPHEEVDVSKVIIHPKFYSGGIHNDIALLILERELPFKDHIDVICLPPQDYVVPDGTQCLASGWGKDAFEKNGTYQVILKKINLPYVERNRCQKLLSKTRLGRHFILDKSLVCAGGKAGEDTCSGDGGSPLVCPIPGQPGRYLHAGIVAWGIDCGMTEVPAAYANVAMFRNWIDDKMALNDLDPSEYQY